MYSSEMIEYLKEIKRYPDGFPFPFEASEKRGVRLAELHYHDAAGSCK